MTCRPVRLVAADNNIAMDEEFIDLMTWAHMQAPYPNVQRWLAAMKKLPNWGKVNEAFDSLREAVKGQQFVTLA
jgi:hypothetical protein